MKHLLYLLIVLNSVYFAWHMVHGMSDGEVVRELPPLPPDTRRLMTLQELRDRQRTDNPPDPDPPARNSILPASDSMAAIKALTQVEPPAAGMPLACYSLGPFLKEADVSAAMSRIRKLGREASRSTREAEVKIGYWIYLPAMPREQALEYKAILDENKDKEYFIGKDNVISLGAFKEKGRADRRMKQLRKIGIRAVLEPRYKTRNVFWLDLGEGLTGADRERLRSDLPGVGLERQACR